MFGTFSISGLASGIDTEGMIARIMEFERRPIELLGGRIEQKTNLLSAYKTFEANLLALKVDMGRLTKRATFEAKTANVSDEDVLTASVSSTAPAGTYTINVLSLAQNHQIVSAGFADTNTTQLGTGTFTIQVGERSALEIGIDENNNTLEGLAQAINDADGDVQATIVNSGDPTAPYRLLLTSKHTGSAEVMSIDSDLSGGVSPGFGVVGPVVPGIMTGTSTVSSSGSFAGSSSGTIAFTVDAVQGGGKIGQHDITISYDDGADLSGSFVLPSDYVPGGQFDIVAGLQLSFSAGDLNVGDTFAVDVTTASIQEAADAEISLGSSASTLTIKSAENSVSGVIEGVTLDLLKASTAPITLNIQSDRAGIKESVSTFVDQYNGFVSFMNDMFRFDPDLEIAGEFLGEIAAQELYTNLQNRLTGTVEGLEGTIDHLVEIGIRLNSDGTLLYDDGQLDELLNEDLDSVMKLFIADGRTTDPNIQFLVASSATRPFEIGSEFPNGYGVNITQVAEKALFAAGQFAAPTVGSPLVLDGTNNTLKINIDGRESGVITLTQGDYTSGSDLAAEIQKQIEQDDTLSGISVAVNFVDGGGGNGHFEFESATYGSKSRVEFLASGNSIYSSIGVTSGQSSIGQDVAGTIGGEEATGFGQILEGNDDNQNTDGLQLLVTLTADQLASQGEDQGFVTVTKGFAARAASFVDQITTEGSGKVRLKQNELDASIKAFEDQISRTEERLEKKRLRLVREFGVMEQLIGDLQGQSDFLSGALANLAANTRSIRSTR